MCVCMWWGSLAQQASRMLYPMLLKHVGVQPSCQRCSIVIRATPPPSGRLAAIEQLQRRSLVLTVEMYLCRYTRVGEYLLCSVWRCTDMFQTLRSTTHKYFHCLKTKSLETAVWETTVVRLIGMLVVLLFNSGGKN